MSTAPLQLPPLPRATARSPLVATLLSLVLPGLGHLYVGAMRAAGGLLALHLLLPPALTLAWALGALDLRGWLLVDQLLRVVLRLLAAVLAIVTIVRTRSRPLPASPTGVYGIFVVGAILITFISGQALQRWVPSPVELSAPGAGLEQGEYVQATRLGQAASPRVGSLALFVMDVPDAAVGPATPSKRDAFVGRVVAVSSAGFAVEGRDAEVPLVDYVGVPAGVVLSRDGGMRWDRLGVAPR